MVIGGGGALPKVKPFIVSDRERYDPGDTLRANCTLPASRPTVHLSFTLNNSPSIFSRHQLDRYSWRFLRKSVSFVPYRVGRYAGLERNVFCLYWLFWEEYQSIMFDA
ncbi:hypothetical protein M0804_009708 [Polistes exclamans]|nr:hypothetical protein M0804_009708 [Polistes exclamans]